MESHWQPLEQVGLIFTECTSETISKIGQYLAKIWTKLCGLLFLGHPVEGGRSLPTSIGLTAYTSAISAISLPFLADRTNGRAYATLLRPSVVVCRL